MGVCPPTLKLWLSTPFNHNQMNTMKAVTTRLCRQHHRYITAEGSRTLPTLCTSFPVRQCQSHDPDQERHRHAKLAKFSFTNIRQRRTPQTVNGVRYISGSSSSSSSSGYENQLEEEPTEEEEHEEEKEDLGPNPGLASVISQGISKLEQTAYEVESKTRKSISDNQGYEKAEPSPRQLMEAQRIFDIATECLEGIASPINQEQRSKQLVTVAGEPIVIVHVDVNPTLKLAKVYWCLPYSILLNDEINSNQYRQLVLQMNDNLLKKGGENIVQRYVHNKLRSYYPPRMRFLPATNSMIHDTISELL